MLYLSLKTDDTIVEDVTIDPIGEEESIEPAVNRANNKDT